MIQATGLVKRYGPHTAVDQATFTIRKGEIVGFLGPNGAGKSTTMNILTGYLSASEGSVTVDDFDILESPQEVRKRIGYLPENPPLYPELTVREYLRFAGRIKGLPSSEVAGRMQSVMETTGTAEVQKRLIRNLSKGYKQRVGIAQALMGKPEILILDEPTSGLDPKQIIEIRKLIQELGKDHTVILSSHILPEVSAVCQRVLIMNRGRIVADDTTQALSKRITGGSSILVRAATSFDKIKAAVAGLPGLTNVVSRGSTENGTQDVLLEANPESDIRSAVFKAFCGASLPLLQMRSVDLTLEEIFLHVTTEEGER